MQDAGISSGDILIVDCSLEPKDRQDVVALLEGEFNVRRLRQILEKVFLEAENSAFKPIQVAKDQELIIWVFVTFVIHQAV